MMKMVTHQTLVSRNHYSFIIQLGQLHFRQRQDKTKKFFFRLFNFFAFLYLFLEQIVLCHKYYTIFACCFTDLFMCACTNSHELIFIFFFSFPNQVLLHTMQIPWLILTPFKFFALPFYVYFYGTKILL